MSISEIMKTGIRFILPCLYIFGSLLIAQVNFVEHTVDTNVGGSGSVFGCDIDSDGDLDLLLAGIEDNSIILYRNDNGSPIIWTKYIIDSLVNGARSVHANDFDNDGDLDIVGAAYTGYPSVLWWRNDGGDPITWTRQTLSNNELLAKSVHAGDIDNNGNIDVVGAALRSNDVAWWKNEGGNPIIWTKNLVDGNFVGSHRVEVVDIDNDGDKDILGAGYTGNIIAWWRNDGGNPINWNKQIIATKYFKACVATAKDIDGDGDIDVIGTGQASNQVTWWENDGRSPITWVKHIVVNNFIRPWPLFVGDANGDGDNDIFVASSHNGSRRIHCWENTTALDIESQSELSNSFRIFQNYPNPFNPTTKIDYYLPISEEISISVFNALGNMVKELYNGYQESGQHSLIFSGKSLPSGFYYYILKSSTNSVVKKCLLLK